jgi:hypothetical protein
LLKNQPLPLMLPKMQVRLGVASNYKKAPFFFFTYNVGHKHFDLLRESKNFRLILV